MEIIPAGGAARALATAVAALVLAVVAVALLALSTGQEPAAPSPTSVSSTGLAYVPPEECCGRGYP
jgi:hypothetical protein